MRAARTRRNVPARRAAAVAIAIALDWWLGELPTSVHPVGWVGRAASYLRRRAPEGPRARLRYGMVAPPAVLALAGGVGFGIERSGRRLPWLAGAVIEGGALSTTVSLRTLLDRAREVELALADGDLDGARVTVGRHLVSRDTAALEPHEVASATIESVAENLSDGVVAPLLAYAVAGVPGALVYRAANTFDSLWGYRTPEFLELGRHVARLDDALNLVPSRVSAGALVAATLMRRGVRAARRALDVWVDEGDLTPSPNAGQPMGAMAGALNVELAKTEEYRLNAGGGRAVAADIEAARDLVLLAAGLVASAIILGLGARAVIEGRR